MRVTKNKTGIIILAAGESSRFGQPKQLLKFNGKSLICRAVKTAIESVCFPVVVVLGANFDLLESEIENLDCEIAENRNRHGGMSFSIKSGIEKMLEIAPDISAVIISLCDQPLIESADFNLLCEKYEISHKPIIASVYDDASGVPALFAGEMFEKLKNLKGDQGAKKLIAEHPEAVEEVFLEKAAFDIDTAADYRRFLDNFETDI